MTRVVKIGITRLVKVGIAGAVPGKTIGITPLPYYAA
jgi:hypothetical protein